MRYNNKNENESDKYLLDKTKRLLSKNSFDNMSHQKTNYGYNHNNHRKFIGNNSENEYFKYTNRNPTNDNLSYKNDLKNSMIIINNNININTYVDDKIKKDINLEKKYYTDIKIHQDKYTYKKDRDYDIPYNKQNDLRNVKLELDYNYNLYSKDFKRLGNKKDYSKKNNLDEFSNKHNIYNENRNCKYENIDYNYEKISRPPVSSNNYIGLEYLSRENSNLYGINQKYNF